MDIEYRMSARKARSALADHRALEEEAERVNPVNPIRKSTKKGYTGIVRDPVSGSGATPSMGLSQFRGGAGSACGAGEEMVSDDEAEMMGGALSKHIMDLHGGAFHGKFLKGMGLAGGKAPAPFLVAETSGEYEGKGRAKKQSAKAREDEKLGMEVKGLKDKVGMGKSGGRPMGAGPMGGRAIGAGPLEIEIKHEQMEGGAKSDKRKARGAMVSKLMKEKGMSLGEASKYIKEHGC